MVGKIKAVIFGPFGIALLIVLLLVGGIAGGIVFQKKSDAAKLLAAQEARRAAAAASAGPQKPQLQVEPPRAGPDPVAPRYIPLGEEFRSNLGRSARFILVEITVVTRFGKEAEELLQMHKPALQASVTAALSELTFAYASKPEAQDEIAARLTAVLNEVIFEREKIRLVEQILITRVIVK